MVQFDGYKRVVALSNLKAMCDYVSGVCHTYRVVKVSKQFVRVEYSNPNEYGTPNPMTAVFPLIPGYEENMPNVVMDIVKIYNDHPDKEGHQSFDSLLDCPQLWRDSQTGNWAPVPKREEGAET